MNALYFITLASVAALTAASGLHGDGVILSGPSGVVTNHGPIGPNGPAGVGLVGVGGWGHGGWGQGGWGQGGWGQGGWGQGAWGHGAVAVAAAPIVVPSAVVAAPVIAGHGLGLGLGVGLGHGLGHGLGGGVITNGGGTIGVSAHGAAIRGPPTAPVVVAGPSGKIVADGLWGPTANVGLGGHGNHW